MATTSSPLAVYAAQDQASASTVIQNLGSVSAVAVPAADLGLSLQALASLRSKIDASDPIVLLVSSTSASSVLFQDVALYCQSQSKRLIVIDLDDAGTANVTGNIKNFGDSMIPACDPELEGILDGPDKWSLPSGEPYPETGIKHQPKC